MKTEQSWRELTREERGRQIAKTCRIRKTEKGYIVPSQTGSGNYLVQITSMSEKCNCPDNELTKIKCKHIYAVECILTQEVDSEGNMIITKEVKVTYGQKWNAYTLAQTNEQRLFMELLNDLCGNIEQPLYKFGRPS